MGRTRSDSSNRSSSLPFAAMNKLLPFLALSAAAAILSGCGGGGGGAAPGGGTPNGTPGLAATAASIRVSAAEIPVAAGVPFDAGVLDNNAALPWGTPSVGKAPEIVPFANTDGTVDVAWRDQNSNVVRIVRDVAGTPSAPVPVTGLGRLMGFARDAAGNMYVATATAEDLTASSALAFQFRQDVVEVVKLDAGGAEQWRTDVTNLVASPSNAADDTAAIYSPMVAGTARLAVGGGRLMLLFSKNTEYDPGAGARHQMQMYISLDAGTGAQTAPGVWRQSHSFDQRLAWDPASGAFVGLSLGDAYDRAIAIQRVVAGAGANQIVSRNVFAIKDGDNATTAGGYNNTFTRLGGMARDAAGGWVAVFATENSPVTAIADHYNAPRNLALVRVLPSFWSIAALANPYDIQVADTSFGSPFGVTVNFPSAASARPGLNKGVAWLTSYTDRTAENVERPRIAAIGGGLFLLAWEKWTRTAHVATYAMVVDAQGRTAAAPVHLPGQRLNRGDDIVAAGNKVFIVTGRGSPSPRLLVTTLAVEQVQQ